MKKILKFFLFLIFILLIFFIVAKFSKIVAKHYFKLENKEIIEYYSQNYEVDPYLICAIIQTESGFNQYAVSNKGASGYMQLMKSTADWGAEVIGIENYSYDQIFEPEINIQIGIWYVSTLMKQFENIEVALAGYNGGSGNVSSWLKDERYSDDNKNLHTIPFPETDDYIKKVNLNYKIYSKLYEGVFLTND